MVFQGGVCCLLHLECGQSCEHGRSHHLPGRGLPAPHQGPRLYTGQEPPLTTFLAGVCLLPTRVLAYILVRNPPHHLPGRGLPALHQGPRLYTGQEPPSPRSWPGSACSPPGSWLICRSGKMPLNSEQGEFKLYYHLQT